jgi:hypothetical protein
LGFEVGDPLLSNTSSHWNTPLLGERQSMEKNKPLSTRKSKWAVKAAKTAVVGSGVLGLVMTNGLPAQADYYSGGMPNRTFNYRTHGINSTWVSIYDTANIRWNQRVGSTIGRSTSAKADATAGSYSQSWYGQYTPHGARGINRTFTIKVNVRTLSKDGGSHFSDWCYSTTTHEVGHSLSLTDDPHTSSASIMKHNRNRTTSQLPTSYDISEVFRIY